MARVLRGDVFWAILSPSRGHELAGRRPVVVLSNNVFNERSGTVIAMAITSQPQKAGYPLTHLLRSGDLPKESWAKISQVRTLSVLRLNNKIGQIEAEELERLIEGLNEIVSG